MFISCAQNFEDVILYRALKSIENGFYIDVGANDPVVDSVTKAFYDDGWRGINIEPVQQWFDRLRQERPRDINLQVLAGAAAGESAFFEVVDTGMSSMDEAIARGHRGGRSFDVRSTTAKVATLSEIWDESVPGEVHFLKIDVEGAEAEVLAGLDLARHRPWVLVVEATLPGSTVANHLDWEGRLTGNGYEFCYFDGLNRFYCAKEHGDLKEDLSVPPNIFDGFGVSGLSSSPLHQQFSSLREENAQQKSVLEKLRREREAQQQTLQAELTQRTLDLERSRVRIAELEQATHNWWSMADHLSRQLQEVHASRSWRLTAPLRDLGRAPVWIAVMPMRLAGALIRRVKALIRTLVLHAVAYVRLRPGLRVRAARIMRKFPKIEARRRRLVQLYCLPGPARIERSLSPGGSPPLFVHGPVPAAFAASPEQQARYSHRTLSIFRSMHLDISSSGSSGK